MPLQLAQLHYCFGKQVRQTIEVYFSCRQKHLGSDIYQSTTYMHLITVLAVLDLNTNILKFSMSLCYLLTCKIIIILIIIIIITFIFTR